MNDRLVSVINRTRKISFMNRKLPITAVMLSVLIILSSCGMTTKPSETSTTSAISSARSSSAEAAITEGSTVEPVHMDHTFNPHCLSQIYVDKYGKDYHCDLTFQLNERATLSYFGMDDKQREIKGDCDMQYNSFGDTNDIWYKDLKLEDKRFEPLWTITSYKIDRENHKLCCYDSYECTGDLICEIPLG